MVSGLFCALELNHLYLRGHAAIAFAFLLGVVGYTYTISRWTQGDDSLYWASVGSPPRY